MKLQTIKTGLKWNTLSALLQALLKVARGMLIPKILPSIGEYGLFTSVNLYTRYLNFSDFGSKEYMLKHLPALHLNSKVDEEKRLINETVTVHLLTFLFVTIYLSISSWLYFGENRDFYRTALILLIPSIFLVRGKDILSIIANSRLQYKDVARTQMLWDFSSFLLTVVGVIVKGAIGGVIAMVLANMISFFYIYSRISITYSFTLGFLNKKRLQEYWSLFTVYVMEVLSNSYDLLILMLLFSVEEYGLYSLGLISVWVMIAIGGVIQTTIQPKIFSLGRTENNDVEDILISSMILLFCLALIAAPFLILGLKLIVTFYITNYIEGLSVYYILVFAGIFRSVNIVLKLFYIAQKREHIYRKMLLGVFCVLGMSFFVISKNDFGLNEVVWFFLAVDLGLFICLIRTLYGVKLLRNNKAINFLVMVTLGYVCGIVMVSNLDAKTSLICYAILTIVLYSYLAKLLLSKADLILRLLRR